MLRLLVILLVLANAGFFAWQQGVLRPWVGEFDLSTREPQRLAQQVHPERLVLVTDLQASAPVIAASATQELQVASTADLSEAAATQGPTQCLEAGPYNREEEDKIQLVLSRSLPLGSWTAERFPVPGLWLIYMGPYPDTDSMQRKNSELQRIEGLAFEEVLSPIELRMGFSLGRFNNQADAEAAHNNLQNKGVRTARVIRVRPPMDVSVIRVALADARMQKLLQALPLPAERGFVKCLAP